MMLKAEVYCPTSGRGLKLQRTTVKRHLWQEKIDVVWNKMTFQPKDVQRQSMRQKANSDIIKLVMTCFYQMLKCFKWHVYVTNYFGKSLS